MQQKFDGDKKVIWLGSSRKCLKEFPQPVRNAMGHALFLAQKKMKHPHAKVLSGMGSANVVEIRENDGNGTYRLVYTVEIENYIFVLHSFQKKSKFGIATPKQEIELIKERLKEARVIAHAIKEKENED